MNNPMFDSFMKTLTGPCMAREGEAVLACCSGGVDSTALLDLLVRAAGILHLRVGVVHVDHGIRGEVSRKDAFFVSEHCARLGLPCHLYQLGMSAHAPNIEEQARTGRYEAVSRCMRDHGYSSAATGHTMDDQAETLLYRLIRGSGIRGLAGMDYCVDGLIRPLLSFTRVQIEEYANARNIPHVEDSTNLNTALARNFIRLEIIPSMKKINPLVVKSISRLSEIAREEGELIERLSHELEEASRVFDWGLVRAYRMTDLLNAPRAVMKRMMIRLISEMTGEPRGIDASQVEGVTDVLFGKKAGHTIKRRVAVRCDDGCLVFLAAGPGPYYELDVTQSGTYRIDSLVQGVKIDFGGTLRNPLKLRSPGKGDRCAGKRVVKILADKGVMKSLRPFWPVVVRNGDIVSVAGVFDSEGGHGVRTEFPCHA